ncbi:MAG TPA: hypothetical protein VI136_03780 [Verrucomicrobiae bacterium]
MNAEIQRPQWEIDRILESLLGQNIRVAAESFSPARWEGAPPGHFITPREFVLPDNTNAGGLPFYVEGRLRQFNRQIGVVFVDLEMPTLAVDSSEGMVSFRGNISVILRGPAVVKLAFPFHVEQLPADDPNYWRDMRLPLVQFELPL